MRNITNKMWFFGMVSFYERHADKITGVLSCFDRIILQGTLPDICHPNAINMFFNAQKMRIFDFKQWAEPLRDEIRDAIEGLAAESGIEIEFIRKQRDFRKEERIQEILAVRGDHPGIVHIFSAMESCTAFKPWHDKQTHATFFKYDSGRCLHYYVYFLDPKFGLCYLRIPTWAPFRLQFYCNGHHWLARQLDKQGVGYEQLRNAFVSLDDFAKAQKLADKFPLQRLHQRLDRHARRLCPVVKRFAGGIHWSVMQVEYSTDVVFRDRASLGPLYEELIRTLSHAVKPDQVAMFLGKRLDPRYDGELGSEFATRKEGHCLRNHTLRELLGKSTGQVSRILKRLRNHGLVKKAAKTYKYYLTSFGQQVVATSLKLKELVVIPCLRGAIATH